MFESNDPTVSWDGKIDGNVTYGSFPFEVNVVNHAGKSFSYTGVVTCINPDQVVDACSNCLFPDQLDPDQGFVHPTQETFNCSQ